MYYNVAHPGRPSGRAAKVGIRARPQKFWRRITQMRCKSALKSAVLGIFGASTLATALYAQGAPWRGAGVQPCYGPEGGSYQCPPAAGVVAVRAGQLFDSKTGQMLT